MYMPMLLPSAQVTKDFGKCLKNNIKKSPMLTRVDEHLMVATSPLDMQYVGKM